MYECRSISAFDIFTTIAHRLYLTKWEESQTLVFTPSLSLSHVHNNPGGSSARGSKRHSTLPETVSEAAAQGATFGMRQLSNALIILRMNLLPRCGPPTSNSPPTQSEGLTVVCVADFHTSPICAFCHTFRNS